MARTHKQPPKQNLALLPVLIEDETSYSEYFEISELSRIFHAGRNGFLIRGTDFLRDGSRIAIEVVDRFGNPVFATPVANYSEGGSRLVSIEVYQDTERGPGRLIVVGEATQYVDGRPIPEEWQGRINTRWSVPIQIEPGNENRTRIRLANDPEVAVNEQNFDITRVDAQDITISDYTASLTYDYDVQKSDGYAIEMLAADGSPATFFDEINESGSFTGSLYRRVIEKLYDGGIEVPESSSVIDGYRTASVSLSLDKILNESDAITQNVIQFNGEDFPTTNLISGSFEYVVQSSNLGNNLEERLVEEYTSSVTFEYVERTLTSTASTSSIVNFRIPFVQTHTGEIARVKITAKEANDNITAYQPFAEFSPDEKNILITTSSIGNIGVGEFSDNSTLQNNWHAGRFLVNSGTAFNRPDYEATESVDYPLTLTTSSTNILEGAVVDNTQSSDSFFFGTKTPIELYEQIEYTLKYTAVYNPTYESGSTTFTSDTPGDLDVYLTRTGFDSASRAESAVVITNDEPYGKLVDEVDVKQNDKSLYEREVNFRVLKNGLAHLRFVSNEGFWSFGEIEITPALEKGFNPDEIVFDTENNILVNSTNVFKIQFLNWNDEPIDYQLITSPIFISGARDPGLDGFTITLSNGAHVFPADSTGSVTSYEGGGTDIEVFNGNTPLDATLSTPTDGFFSASIVSSSNITPNQPPIVNGSVLTYGDPSGMPDSVNSASITYKITSKFANSTYTFIKKQNFSKTPGGADGISPVGFSLTPTSQTVAAGTDGSVPGTFQDIIISGSQGTDPLVYNQSPTLGNGEFKITNVSGSITVVDPTPATPRIQITAASQDTNFVSVFIEYKTLEGTTSTTTLYFTVTKSIEGDAGDPGPSGRDGEIYYIRPLDGRSFKIDPATEAATPDILRFETIKNIGATTQSIDSSSAYGLFYSSSGFPVSQSGNLHTYQVEPINILGHDSLEFISASAVVDTIDVSDITDGFSAIYPVFNIIGALTFISGSDGGITPNTVSKITASMYKGPDIAGTVHAEIGPDNSQITGSIISSSTQVSGSFETFIEGSKIRNVNFLLFSGSGGTAEQIGKETFYLVRDGSSGLTGSNAVSVFASPSSQFVSESAGGSFATPTDFNIIVTEQATQYTFDGTLSANSSFSHSIVQSGSSTVGGIITPDPITSAGQYEVQVNVFYKDSEGNTTINPLPITHSLVTSRDGADGLDGEIYYIRPLDGRAFKIDPNTNIVTPPILRFETVQNEGGLVQTINSGSGFGIFYSSSDTLVTTGSNAYTWAVSESNINGYDSLEFRSGSNVLDTIDVTDITDGYNAVYPVLSVDGVLTFVSASDDTITPTEVSQISASIYTGSSEQGYVYAEVGPTPQNEITGSIITVSGEASGSFKNITKGGTVRNVTFSLFSGSAGNGNALAKETFYLSIDGQPGQSGSDGQAGRDALNVYMSPASQVVSQSTAGNINDPLDFKVTVVQGENTFTYNPGLTGQNEFELTVIQSGSLPGAGFVTPDTPGSPGQYEVHVDVGVLDGYGSSSTIPVTHSLSTALDGQTGPGVVFTGTWTGSRTYQYSEGASGRRDAVIWSGSSGEIDTYFATLQQHSGQEPQSGSDTAYWEVLGTEDYFVAAKIGIFEESFVQNTINIGQGSNNGVSAANITLVGGTDTPYISIGQTTQDYNQDGIFIGSGSAAKLSLKSTTGGLFFDGTDLSISGSISASSGNIAGDLSVGDGGQVIIGPNSIPSGVLISSYTLTPNSIGNTIDPLFALFDEGTTWRWYDTTWPIVGNHGPFYITESIQSLDLVQYHVTVRTGTDWFDREPIGSVKLIVSQSTDTTPESFPINLPTDLEDELTTVCYYTPQNDASVTAITSSLDGTIGTVENGGPVYEYDIEVIYSNPKTSVNGSGIFVDYGYGEKNLLTVALNRLVADTFIPGTSTGGSAGTQSLQDVTDVGSTTDNAISITNITDSTTVGTGALTVDGGVGIDKHIVVGLSGSATDWVATSDIRLKNVLSQSPYGLNEVMKMSPILYKWKDGNKGTRRRVGLSAQEVLDIVPEVVHGSEDSYYTLSYDSLVPVLINAIKDLKSEVDMLRQYLPPSGSYYL